ncbi:MAG TPA: hypothetical protein VK488_04045 [Gaiellaceae bacterium]|nr:hypothetical protein [Gaiellaceae bacterium]
MRHVLGAGELEVSARPFSYRANGELNHRVFALYRRRVRTMTARKGHHG